MPHYIGQVYSAVVLLFSVNCCCTCMTIHLRRKGTIKCSRITFVTCDLYTCSCRPLLCNGVYHYGNCSQPLCAYAPFLCRSKGIAYTTQVNHTRYEHTLYSKQYQKKNAVPRKHAYYTATNVCPW